MFFVVFPLQLVFSFIVFLYHFIFQLVSNLLQVWWPEKLFWWNRNYKDNLSEIETKEPSYTVIKWGL